MRHRILTKGPDTPAGQWTKVEREVQLNPRKAIRRMCLECMGFSPSEVAKCTSEQCPLYPFRMSESADSAKGVNSAKRNTRILDSSEQRTLRL